MYLAQSLMSLQSTCQLGCSHLKVSLHLKDLLPWENYTKTNQSLLVAHKRPKFLAVWPPSIGLLEYPYKTPSGFPQIECKK